VKKERILFETRQAEITPEQERGMVYNVKKGKICSPQACHSPEPTLPLEQPKPTIKIEINQMKKVDIQ